MSLRVSAGNFVAILVQKQEIEIKKNKAKGIIEAKPLTNKKEPRWFMDQINFLRCFISSLAGKVLIFLLLRL